jgi:hypothetical protein
MRLLLTSSFLLLIAFAPNAQTISIYKTFGGVLFQRDSLPISAKQVHSLLQENSQAYQEFSLARKNSTVASVLGFTGGLLIGVPLGTLLTGAEPEWGLALAGVAFIGVSIPFNKAFVRHAANAIDLYNQPKAAGAKAKGEVFFSGTSVGLRIRF